MKVHYFIELLKKRITVHYNKYYYTFNDSLFVYAGLTSEFAEMCIENINKYALRYFNKCFIF